MTPILSLLWRILRAALSVLVFIVLSVVILLAAEIAGAYVDQACVSRATYEVIGSLAARVVPFLPHSTEGGGLLVGGDVFIPAGGDVFIPGASEWPGLERAIVDHSSQYPIGRRTNLPLRSRQSNMTEVKFPDDFMPPLSLHAMAAVSAFGICGASLLLVRQEHPIRSLLFVCKVGLILALLTIPFAFAAWSGPQLVRIFWEQLFSVSGHGFVIAQDRVWVQPALAETSGVLCFGIMYVVCMCAGARRATKFLCVGDRARCTSGRRVIGSNGVACCWSCGYPIKNPPTCPECGLAHSDLPPRGWPWNSRWFRTQRARRVTLLLLVGTAVTVSAALPLLVGVAQVLLKRL